MTSPKVVVVVSDDPLLREDASFSFPEGYDVLLADDARDALRIMDSRSPSLAIVDIQTGSAGGFNLAREMHLMPRLKDVPVLMLLERHQDSWLATQAGARRWRTKPLDGLALVQEATSLLSANA
jgi:DNA-binding response OmpR family regulator